MTERCFLILGLGMREGVDVRPEKFQFMEKG